ncbi:hypothetical protein [Mucilaginibacter sp. CSA2-8R]|uniref:hypothetical protein n=1 Tax=Mucilaginibacter sp. CSA2-8R TaxID=3141542 RepID=UPI00315DC45D
MNGQDPQKQITEDQLRNFKHDVKNQLSNINLALEQLRYEIEHPSDDALFYMDTITMSCAKINNLVQGI